MEKKFYLTPEMEEIELKNVSLICASFGGSDPAIHNTQPDDDDEFLP